MKEVQITYTILDKIMVPDDCTAEEIEELCRFHFFETEFEYNDLEWELV